VVIGENINFIGEEALLRSRGVKLEVLSNSTCIEMMDHFIKTNPTIWNEDIGTSDDSALLVKTV
jgi:cytosine deaminase